MPRASYVAALFAVIGVFALHSSSLAQVNQELGDNKKMAGPPSILVPTLE